MKNRKFFTTSVFIAMATLFASSLHAQDLRLKKQVLISSSLMTPWNGNSRSMAAAAGFALIKPLSKTVFVKSVVGAGSVTSLASGSSYPMMQAATVVGRKLTKRFSVGGGGGITFLWPHNAKALKLPTGIAFTATSISKHFSVITPLSFHQRSYGLAAQLAYTW
jgi:hypothetical protein